MFINYQAVGTTMSALAMKSGGFSSQKQALLVFLKKHEGPSLTEVARELGISKVAALRHLAALEREELVERFQLVHGVGRPSVHFRLRPESRGLFPEAYTDVSLAALAYLEEKLGRAAVAEVLERRSREVRARHAARFRDKSLPDRVRELERVREEGGYMPEASRVGKRHFQLCEYNCPILAIAGRFGEACESERRLFEGWLGAGVKVTHRVVAGAPVCRFLIRGPEER